MLNIFPTTFDPNKVSKDDFADQVKTPFLAGLLKNNNSEELLCGDVWTTVNSPWSRQELFCQIELKELEGGEYSNDIFTLYAYENNYKNDNRDTIPITNYDTTFLTFDFEKTFLLNLQSSIELYKKNEIDNILKGSEDKFFGWAREDVLSALARFEDLPEEIVEQLQEKHDDLGNAIAEKEQERINQLLIGTPYKVTIYETSENYNEDLKREERNEYWNLGMFEASVEERDTEEIVDDTTTGRYVDIDSVIKEIREFVNDLIPDIDLDVNTLSIDECLEQIEKEEAVKSSLAIRMK